MLTIINNLNKEFIKSIDIALTGCEVSERQSQPRRLHDQAQLWCGFEHKKLSKFTCLGFVV